MSDFQPPKVISSAPKPGKSGRIGGYNRRQTLLHNLERVIAVASNNLDGFKLALDEAKRITKELRRE